LTFAKAAYHIDFRKILRRGGDALWENTLFGVFIRKKRRSGGRQTKREEVREAIACGVPRALLHSPLIWEHPRRVTKNLIGTCKTGANLSEDARAAAAGQIQKTPQTLNFQKQHNASLSRIYVHASVRFLL
jgi:hypothetical protein